MAEPKKWFMLQIWRIQQVAQLATIVLLSLNVAGMIFASIDWRVEGTAFEKSYVTIPLLMAVIGMIIWLSAIWWDTRMRMWREQATVLVERNPYAKEKLSAKEVALYELLWLPMLDKMAQGDPKIKDSISSIRAWIHRSYTSDPLLAADVKDVFQHIDEYRQELEKQKSGKK